MNQNFIDQLEAIRKQEQILSDWKSKLIKDCDHKYPDGKDALIVGYSSMGHDAHCSICRQVFD